MEALISCLLISNARVMLTRKILKDYESARHVTTSAILSTRGKKSNTLNMHDDFHIRNMLYCLYLAVPSGPNTKFIPLQH